MKMMREASNTCSISEILAFSHPGVVERISRDSEISNERARGIFEDTLRFLFLAAITGEPIPPTKAIDSGWHAFLLFTRDYADFCTNYLGRFIHHRPYTEADKATPGFDEKARLIAGKAFDLARKHFGNQLSENWSYEVGIGDCESTPCSSQCSPDSGGGGSECTPD